MRDCSSVRSTGALSPCMMQTKPLNPHALLRNAGRLVFERGTLSPPIQLAGFPADAALEGGATRNVSNWLELQLYWPPRGAATPFRNYIDKARGETAFPNHFEFAAEFCLATATRSRQSTVE